VVVDVIERQAVSKQAAPKFYAERFNIRKRNELEVKKRYQIEISSKFAAFENLNDSKCLGDIKENT